MWIHGPCERAQAARPRSVIRHVCLAVLSCLRGGGWGEGGGELRGGYSPFLVASVLTNCARAAIKKGGAEAELTSSTACLPSVPPAPSLTSFPAPASFYSLFQSFCKLSQLLAKPKQMSPFDFSNSLPASVLLSLFQPFSLPLPAQSLSLSFPLALSSFVWPVDILPCGRGAR